MGEPGSAVIPIGLCKDARQSGAEERGRVEGESAWV